MVVCTYVCLHKHEYLLFFWFYCHESPALWGASFHLSLSLVYSSVLVSSEGTHHHGLNYRSPYSSG